MYYAYQVKWGQTDWESVIFFCTNDPDEYIRRKMPGAIYYTLMAKAKRMI